MQGCISIRTALSRLAYLMLAEQPHLTDLKQQEEQPHLTHLKQQPHLTHLKQQEEQKEEEHLTQQEEQNHKEEEEEAEKEMDTEVELLSPQDTTMDSLQRQAVRQDIRQRQAASRRLQTLDRVLSPEGALEVGILVDEVSLLEQGEAEAEEEEVSPCMWVPETLLSPPHVHSVGQAWVPDTLPEPRPYQQALLQAVICICSEGQSPVTLPSMPSRAVVAS